MNGTLTHRGAEYTVEVNEDKNTDMAPYFLTNSKGKKFVLVRNQKDPSKLFAIHHGKFGVPSGHWWFIEKDGQLKSMTP